MENILIKLIHQDAKVPTRANPQDAGADLFSVESCSIGPLERKMVSTGICIKIPEGYYGRIAPRSGLAYKNGIDVLAGVVDSSYIGEIKVILFNSDSKSNFIINSGDRIAQLIIEAHYNFKFDISEELGYTERGEKGFGSSGVQ